MRTVGIAPYRYRKKRMIPKELVLSTQCGSAAVFCLLCAAAWWWPWGARAQAAEAKSGYAPVELCPFSAGVEPGIELWGFINARGEVVAEPVYTYAFDFIAGRALVGLDGKAGYVGPDGQLAIPARFSVALNFSPNGLALAGTDKEYGYIDTGGKLAIRDRFGSLAADFAANGLARAGDGDKYGFIDATGELRIPLLYDDATDFGDDSGLAGVRVGRLWGFIAADGGMVVPPAYQEVGKFASGLCPVRRDGLWGYIDASGKEIIPLQFVSAESFSGNGLALVSVFGDAPAEGVRPETLYGFIDAKGNFAIEPQYETAWGFAPCGLAPVRVGGKWGVVDAHGNMVVPPRFEDAEVEEDSRFVTVVSDGKIRVVGGDGEIYDELREYGNGLTLKIRDGAGGYVDARGETALRVEIVNGLTVVRTRDGVLLYPDQSVLERAGGFVPPL